MKPQSFMYLCGEGGCEAIPLDPVAFDAADRARMAFARAYEKEHGEFPPIEMQLDVVADEYEAVALRRTMKVIP